MEIVKKLIIFLIAFAVNTAACYADSRVDCSTICGPNINEVRFLIISNPDAQVMAAEAGDVDLISDITRPSDIERLSRNKHLDMSLSRGMHAFFLLINNKRAPWNDAAVRRAAAMSIDRANIVRMIFSGYCEPINSYLPPVSPWAKRDSARDIYDPRQAREILKKAGYRWDISGRLIMPDGKRMPEMKILTPLARVAPTTAELAELMADSMRAVGFPVVPEPIDFSTMIGRLDRHDYSMAVLAWGMGRNPDSLYSFYHSEMDVEGGYNMTGIHNAQLDRELKKLRYAPDKQSAEAASSNAQTLLAALMPSVPVYSRFSVAAVSKNWENVFTTDKMTADNVWTLLTVKHKTDKNAPFRMILAEEPRNLNPFTASSAYSWQVLGLIYDSLLTSNPYTLETMPNIAEKWDINSVGKSTIIRFTLRQGLKWSDASPLTAYDVKASIDFIRKNKIPRFFDTVKNITAVNVLDKYSVEVRSSEISYWNLDNIGGLPILPKQTIDGIKDWQRWSPKPAELVGCGPFMLKSYRAGEYVIMTKNPYYFRLKTK